MLYSTAQSFAYQQTLVAFAGAVCLFGTWIGMRHFARARATEGSTRRGWLFMASVGTGVALWASTFISILALDPLLSSGFEPVATGAVLIIAVVACFVGFEIGSRHFTAGAGSRRPCDGRRHPCHASGRIPGLAHQGQFRVERLWPDDDPYARARPERARRQPRQPPGDALVPAWCRDRARFHDLRDALLADRFGRGCTRTHP